MANAALMNIIPVTYTYISDCLGPRAVEGIAASNGVRYVCAAAASAFVLPLIDGITVAGANGEFL